MADITRQQREAALKATQQALIEQLQKSGGHLKQAAVAAKANKHGRFASSCADAIVNIIEAGDMIDKNIMAKVFKRLKQIDRMEDS